MFAYLLLTIQLLITGLGIYLFDYKMDNRINQVSVILLSILAGFFVMLLVFYLYIEVFYYFVAKKKSKTSKSKHFIAKQLMTVPLFITNTKFRVLGLENLPKETGFSIYSNHTSMFDIPLLMRALQDNPVAFLAKQSIAKLPAIGKWTDEIGCVMIDRSNARKGAEAIIQVIKNIKSGSTMVIFPEGTRSEDATKLNDFKAGSFKIALKSKAPLVPITIQKRANFKKIKWPLRKRVTVVIHKAIPFDTIKTMTSIELSDHVESIIKASLLV